VPLNRVYTRRRPRRASLSGRYTWTSSLGTRIDWVMTEASVQPLMKTLLQRKTADRDWRRRVGVYFLRGVCTGFGMPDSKSKQLDCGVRVKVMSTCGEASYVRKRNVCVPC